MRQRGMGRFGTMALVMALAALPPGLRAQQGEDDREGGAVFAGGQMVRGTVTAAAADHLTVKTEAGEVYQVVFSANTRVNKDRQPVKVTDIKAGDGVGAMGVLDPATKTVHAVFVGVMDAEQVKKAREGMGKVYITGKVTAIDMDALKLTVLRPDGVTQVIGVDEQTSFKRGGRGMSMLASGAGVTEMGPAGGRGSGAGNAAGDGSGGESITLADVKVGDAVAGRGALKNGLFVPTELGVSDAAARRRRRELSGNGAVAAPAAAPAKPAAVPQ
ncbi:hypothetical protein [Tunturibacter empetritectus]|uniref:DUF5666 domain-containing protein n=1 Tax=Tunturiibacter empetritectus TaxID=3069691 RepID=A0A7W8MR37_9BACT|nr:hypothetical protein [Edaphobacter lichenicola]MBB5316857.1 hypothetical protein [Edaphobacter lichenicola]